MPLKKPIKKVIERTQSFDKNIRIALGVTAVVVLWMLSGLILPSDTHSNEANATGEAVLKTVAIKTIEAAPYAQPVNLTGIVKASALVEIKAQTDGRIEEIIKQRGEVVKQGEIILKLNTEDKEKAVVAAQAALVEAQSLYKAAKKLNKQGFRADTSLEGQKARLESAEQALKKAKDTLSFTEIKAPFNGITDDRTLNVGDYVRNGDNVVTVIDTSSYLIEGFVAQKKRHLLEVGKTASFTLINGTTVEGVLEFVATAGHEMTKTYRVLVRVDGTKYKMPINMSGKLSIPTQEKMATLIPYSALVLDDRGNLGAMIVTGEENFVEFHKIDPLADSGNGFYIQNLPSKTRLIVKGQNSVTHGEQVAPEQDITESDV